MNQRWDRTTFPLSAALAALLALHWFFPQHSQATDFTWDLNGNAPLNRIDNGLNWVGGIAPDLTSTTADNMIFSATNHPVAWIRGDTVAGDWVRTVTFDVSAPAYTIELEPGFTGVNDLVVEDAIINNSSNTQTFNGGINLRSATMNAALGNILIDRTTGSGQAYVYNSQTASIFTGDHTITLRGNDVWQAPSSSSNRFSVQMTNAGRVIVENDNATLLATTSINNGVLEIRSGGALGSTATGQGRVLNILGGATNAGRLELTNNINVTKAVTLTGRTGGNGLAPHISNLSGTNTLNATFGASSGTAWNFESQAGSVTINGNLALNYSGERGVSFHGAGDGEFTGNITNSSGSALGLAYMKQGSGKWTLSGAASTKIANVIVHQGTLAFGAAANSWTFGTNTDAGVAPRFYTAAAGTLDVSATGTYSLTQVMHGYGTIVGNVAATASSQILPGGQLTYQAGYGGDIFVDVGGFADTVGKLTFTGDLDLSASSTTWQLSSLTTIGPGTNFDQIVVSGNLVLGGNSQLALDFSLLSGLDPTSGNAFWNSNHSWQVIDDGANAGNTNFAAIVNGTFAAGTFSTAINAGDVILNYTAAAPLHPGDFDGDGDVDGADFVAWQTHFPTPNGATRADGDADGDGDVDGADFVVWQTNFPFTPGPGAAPVPEPGSLMLGLAAIGGLAWMRRRNSRGGNG